YHQLFTNIGEGVATVDLKEYFVYCNPAAEMIFGVPAGKLVGKNLNEFLSSQKFEVVKNQTSKRKTGEKSIYELEIIRPDRKKRQLLITTTPQFDKERNVIGAFGIVRDITERNRAEKTQKALYNISNAINTTDNMHVCCNKIREYLGNVIDTKNFYVALYDESTDVISLPFEADEKDIFETFPAGKTLTKYVIQLEKPLFAPRKLQDELTEQGTIEIVGTPSEIWLGIPLKIENKVIGVIVVQSYDDPNLYTEKDIDILTFISEEIALAIEHKQAEEQIKRNLAEKTVLLQELYHRTKNNMQVIVSMLKMQSRLSENEFVNTAFREIINKINAMSLVHQKLYQARDLSKINLKEYIEDLAHLLRQSYSLQAANVSLNFELEDTFVLIDSAVPLGMVLNELISNIYKHAFPNRGKGEISIRLYQEENGTINIHLADNGIGIPADLDLRKSSSMGLETMFSLIDYQLKGEATYLVENGLKWHLKFKDDLNTVRV
ncbi:MAG: histidine kinase dimerization/phosphoacceptor domain -containing protein, partial [Candidatus Cloacimonadales bacterium]|nr:histidine kinase dimerization/phosphoacceptor domain -containing protein [Candidatus Cloacimonadales bacterium]